MTVPVTATSTVPRGNTPTATPRPPRPRTPTVSALSVDADAPPGATARPTRITRESGVGGGLPDGTALIQVQVIVCPAGSGTATGFAPADDLQVWSLDPLPPGCRVAVAGEGMVRADRTAADGLPASTTLGQTDASGTIAMSVPMGTGSPTVTLSVPSAGSNAAMTVTVRSGRPTALRLTIHETGSATMAPSMSEGSGDGPAGIDAGGPALSGRAVGSPAGWYAVVALMVVSLAVAALGLRRAARR